MKRLLLVPLMLAVAAVAGEEVPVPIAFGSKEISVCVAVPKLQALLDNSETFLKPFAGDRMQPGAIKAALGMALGDAELTGLEFDKPAVLAIFKAPPVTGPAADPPPMAMFLPAKSADVFAAVLQQA